VELSAAATPTTIARPITPDIEDPDSSDCMSASRYMDSNWRRSGDRVVGRGDGMPQAACRAILQLARLHWRNSPQHAS
jgi:hypothetical protein